MKKINKSRIMRISAWVVFVVSFCCWGYTKLLYLDADVTYRDLTKKTVTVAEEQPQPTTAADGTAQAVPDDPLLEIDREHLLDVNNDYVCWLSACQNKISYPVVQGSDNNKYLHHTFFGDKSFVGSIFLDYRCADDLSDFHTLVYGHSMKDRTMFRLLADFTDKAIAEQYPYFYLYTGDGRVKYRIYSVCDVDGMALPTAIGTPDDEDKAVFIAGLKERSLYTMGDEPTISDSFVSLITCDVRDDSKRVVITGIKQ